MRPSDVLDRHRDEVRAIVAKYRVTNPRVFGSASRREDREESDLDLLVDPIQGTTLFDLGGLQDDLETLLGVPVEVVTPNAIQDRLRDRILRSAKPL